MPLIVTAPPPKPKAPWYLVQWQTEGGIYSLRITDCDFLRIWQQGRVWYARGVLNGTAYLTTKDTLESAFKAIDRLYYKAYPREWCVTDISAVSDPWKRVLPNDALY